MLGYCDNDVLVKLAACDLLERLAPAIRVERSNLRIRNATRYSLGLMKPGAAEGKWGIPTSQRLRLFLSTVKTIDRPPADSDLQLLEPAVGIDEGEAVLFALAARNLDSVVVTGDKESIRALHREPGCEPIARALVGRIVCLEQVVARIIHREGFDAAHACVVPALTAGDLSDQVLRRAFLNQGATEEDVREVLEGAVGALRSESGLLLAP
jgi:hypothetical protein